MEPPRDQKKAGTSKPGSNGQNVIITIYLLDSSGIYSLEGVLAAPKAKGKLSNTEKSPLGERSGQGKGHSLTKGSVLAAQKI